MTQTSTPITNFYQHQQDDTRAPQSLVILLHGLGSDGRDLISLAPLWGKSMPHTMFVSPDAPFPCDMAPMGHQWFSLQDRDPHKVLAGVQAIAPALDAFIEEQLEKYNLPASKLVLGGFSQGCMMSLYVGPRYKDKIAGILGYSGALIWDQDTEKDKLQTPPVFLTHGKSDEVVPFAAHEQAAEVLEEFGFDLTKNAYNGLGHSINQEGLDAGLSFLKSALSK